MKKKMITGVLAIALLTGTYLEVDERPREAWAKDTYMEKATALIVQQAEKAKQEQQNEAKKSLGQFKLTAYCPCCDCSEIWGSKTKQGTTAKEGRTIAVDPDVIPLGSKVTINGRTFTAEDIGGAVKGKTIDVYFDSHEEVEDFGVKYMKVILH